MKLLLFPFELGLFEHQVRFGGLVALLVDHFVEVATREFVEFFLDEASHSKHSCTLTFSGMEPHFSIAISAQDVSQGSSCQFVRPFLENKLDTQFNARTIAGSLLETPSSFMQISAIAVSQTSSPQEPAAAPSDICSDKSHCLADFNSHLLED
ncbi:MAG: hypothetical protein ABSF34_03455 [Verrucomicrobiota bacterium]